MIQTITIQQIRRSVQDKTGKDFSYIDKKTGLQKKFMKVSIFDGEKWYSAFSYPNDDWTAGMAEGQDVKVEVYETTGKDGKNYLNFKKVSQIDTLQAKCEQLEEELVKQRQSILNLQKKVAEMAGEEPEVKKSAPTKEEFVNEGDEDGYIDPSLLPF